MNYLGYNYESGIGFDINIQKANELYQKAVDLGNKKGYSLDKIIDLIKKFVFFYVSNV